MADMAFSGEVWANVIEVHFAFSGRLATLAKYPGDQVKKGELLASLDNSVLQTELDRQLADYEKRRAEFEIEAITPPKNPGDIDKFNKTIVGALMTASIKEVELSKFKLDQIKLTSPIDGIVLDVGGCVPGLNITPSGNGFTLVDTASLLVRINVSQDHISQFENEHLIAITIPGLGKNINGRSKVATPGLLGKDKNAPFIIEVVLDDKTGLLPGMNIEGKIAD